MAETISQLFAFDVTGKVSPALHFLPLCTASTGLYPHLETGGTASPVTSFCTIMGATPEQLATRVSTRGRGLCAFKFVAALAARTRPVQGQGAGGAGPGVADDLTRVMLTREQLAASLSALVLWTRAFPRLLGLPTLARLDAGLCARRTGSIMTRFLARVNSTGKPA